MVELLGEEARPLAMLDGVALPPTQSKGVWEPVAVPHVRVTEQGFGRTAKFTFSSAVAKVLSTSLSSSVPQENCLVGASTS